jgi:hypothetical protein
MLPKVFIASNNTATFVCPQCGNATTANVAKYASIKQRVTVGCRCACGHHFDVSLEKRRQYRKSTDLPGVFYYHLSNGETDKGSMRVVDISSSGLKLKLNVVRTFKEGDHLKVEFHLDDKRRNLMEKEVIVRNVHQNYVGTSFAKDQGDDPNLGFYLMS